MANFIPHNIRQVIDKAYGSKLTSEEYNNILNLLIHQGDYNTDFLNTISNKNISGIHIGTEPPEDDNVFIWINPEDTELPEVQAHTHSNKETLDETTASFTVESQTKLDALITNAEHTGDVVGTTTLTIADNAVTNEKLADVATNTIKGRVSTGSGIVEDLTVEQARDLLNITDGLSTDQLIALTNSLTYINVSATSGVLYSIDLDNARIKNIRITVADNIGKAVVVSNVPTECELLIELNYSNAAAITWFSGIAWLYGVIPTFTVGKVYRIMLFTANGGTSWHGSSVGGW